MIADRPDAAYEICTKYAPNCSGGQAEIGSSTTHQEESSSKQSRSQSEQKTSSKGKSNSKKKSSKSNSTEQPRTSSNKRRSSVAESLQNLEFSTRASNLLNLHADAALVSRDNSAESDGLGAAFNVEEDYYDSLNSGDETEATNSQFNKTRTPIFIEPIDNPEPGIHYIEPVYNPEPGIDDNFDNGFIESDNVSNTTQFSAIVNGVKIKSLPGPRGMLEG